ncbi:MAG: hypothetical protein GY930_02715 [bacterium]|nr:hypothetical protein [bacterium]
MSIPQHKPLAAEIGGKGSTWFRTLIVATIAMICPLPIVLGQTCLQEVAPPVLNSSFGHAVALNDSIAVIGQPFLGFGSNNNRGSATVYSRDTNTGALITEQEFVPSELLAQDRFGERVAVGGNFAVVFSTGLHLTGSGIMYVFERTAGQWTEVAQLVSGEDEPHHIFGAAVAVSEGMILVSAPRRGPASNLRFGAVFVFDKIGGIWQQTQLLESSRTQSGADYFGRSIAADGLNLAIGVGTDLEFYRLNPATRQYALGDRVDYPGTSSGQFFRAIALQNGLLAYQHTDSSSSLSTLKFFERQPGTGRWQPGQSIPGYAGVLTFAGDRLLASHGQYTNQDNVVVYLNSNGAWAFEKTLSLSNYVNHGPVGALGTDMSGSGTSVLLGGGSAALPTGGDRAYLWDFACDTIVSTGSCPQTAPNSSGNPGFLLGFGSQQVVLNGLTLRASQLPSDSFGIFLTGRVAGLTHTPGNSQGDLCLAGDIGHFNATSDIFFTGRDGLAALTVDLTNMPTSQGATSALAGESWLFQGWYRDRNPGPTSNFTNAIQVAFQ